jgi:hypothetical protein
MPDADNFEFDSAAIGREATGPESTSERTAPPGAGGLLTARRVAALLGRTCRTLRNWERRGWLRPVRIGRGIFYRPSDIAALAERGAPTPASIASSAPEPASCVLRAGADDALTSPGNQSVPAASCERA